MEQKVSHAIEDGNAKIVSPEAGDGYSHILTRDDDGKAVLVEVCSDYRRRTSGFGYPLDVQAAVLQQFACGAYQLGQFVESLEMCRELRRRDAMTAAIYECVHLAAAGLGNKESPLQAESNWQANDERVRKIGGHYPFEGLWFQLNNDQLSISERISRVELSLQQVAENLWMVPSAHPTASLLVADWLLQNTERDDLARKLVCCCLGWKYVYRRVDDLMLLAELLHRLHAPKLFWTRIANLYYDFSVFDSVNQETLRSNKQTLFDGLRLALFWKEMDDKEGVLHRFCAGNGFPERDTVTDLMFDSFELGGDGLRKGNLFPGKPGYAAADYAPWLLEDHFQMRHPWFCLLEDKERDFIRNGDTGFVSCVTSDYSMACSQWWRAIESVLRRKLIEPLGRLIDKNPSWVASDHQHAHSLAPEREMGWEELFVRVLSDGQRRKRMTLTHMLILVEKCMSDLQKKKRSRSLVRRNAVQHVGEHLSEFRWIKSEPDEFADMRSAYSPNVLTERSIQSFRNAASHDEPMDYEHAVAGRLLAIRILDFMHYPRYCINEKLGELKQELADKQNESKS